MVVLHRSPTSLSIANPAVPVAWLATAPGARRYVAGSGGGQELQVRAPSTLREWASNVPGSRGMLALGAPALYARGVILPNKRELAPQLMIALADSVTRPSATEALVLRHAAVSTSTA